MLSADTTHLGEVASAVLAPPHDNVPFHTATQGEINDPARREAGITAWNMTHYHIPISTTPYCMTGRILL